MKIKIDILRWDTGELIYSYECEENTIKITLERGVNEKIDFFRAELNWAELNWAELDFSSWGLSCNTLNTLLDQRLIVQLLFHAAKPCENNKIKIDADVRRLFKSKIFIKILQKFHRQDVKEYTGNLK